MSMAVRVLDGGKVIQSVIHEDEERSLFRFFYEAPETAVRWGVSEYRETVFNSKQAYQLMREMEDFPAEQMTPVLLRLREAVVWVHERSGYLQFLGD
ncbi:hypothetical protein ACFW96_38725 [Streptomyces gardneri]|uniref:hypothetical protein n=1 Tax=Streptomyces gardneri TaxID=66892 RepID=UPI0036A87310